MTASHRPALDILRCPDCGETLADAGDDAIRCAGGHRFELITARKPGP